MIDEAGQLSLSSASLVLRSLAPTGKIVVAGDSEQLAPILTAQYPTLKTGSLFGSILDCLMYWSTVSNPKSGISTRSHSPDRDVETAWSQSTIVQLTENFRCAFFFHRNMFLSDFS